MASRSSALAAINVVALLVLCGLPATTEAHTQFGAYNKTCPQAEEIVFKEMTAILAKSPDLAGPVLRLFSVDCLLGGCEGSILLNSTANNTAEKDAPLNKGLRGYDVVDSIKAKLEVACPGVVSCSDVLALAARDSVRITDGPYIPIPTGREDGNRSSAADVAPNSPKPGATVTDLITLFARFNLTAKDLAVLSGAHTIGRAHCSAFSPRLYNFNGSSNASSDPTLDANYTATLRGQCKAGDLATLVDLDPSSGTTFDLGYYRDVAASKGLLSTDAALLLDADTRAYVLRQANATANQEFFADFAVSFVNMSKIGVLTHHKGEIRRQCSVVNPPSAHSAAPLTTMRAHAVLLATSLISVLALALVL
ncbi:peroxidase 1-like [Lolium rigidum]|uniref:peroxidase 1-like n=1 Tax=Lolium rigidum TaxID=89674 RepID=UPI001F5C1119|nr:peroxidase 1-like [Lolium rigidum]